MHRRSRLLYSCEFCSAVAKRHGECHGRFLRGLRRLRCVYRDPNRRHPQALEQAGMIARLSCARPTRSVMARKWIEMAPTARQLCIRVAALIAVVPLLRRFSAEPGRQLLRPWSAAGRWCARLILVACLPIRGTIRPSGPFPVAPIRSFRLGAACPAQLLTTRCCRAGRRAADPQWLWAFQNVFNQAGIPNGTPILSTMGNHVRPSLHCCPPRPPACFFWRALLASSGASHHHPCNACCPPLFLAHSH